jgi:hypothetical protein
MMRYAIFLLLLPAFPAFAAEPVYTWQSRADDPDRVYLYRDSKQIGGWCYREQHYRSFDGEAWGPAIATSPVQPPDRRSQAARDYPLYVSGLLLNSYLFARIEMYAGRMDKLDDDLTKELTTKGSASVFLAERAKFAKKLKQEKFGDPILTMIYLEIEDDDPKWEPVLGNGAFQSMPILATSDSPKAMTNEHGRAVLFLLNHKVRKAQDKDRIPVTAHCWFTFMASKAGRGIIKNLSYDVYLEKVELRKDSYTYPWKVSNVQYK